MVKTTWYAPLAVVAMLLTACGGDADRDATQQPGAQPGETAVIGANVQLPDGVTLDMVQQGKTVFETTTCFTCHGMDATGTALAPSLRDQDWLNSDGSFDGIVGVVRNGVTQPQQYPAAMPAMGGAQLTEDQIRSVSAYVYAISHGG
jgi:cbb3-type cytochrome c oxidase subunit III